MYIKNKLRTSQTRTEEPFKRKKYIFDCGKHHTGKTFSWKLCIVLFIFYAFPGTVLEQQDRLNAYICCTISGKIARDRF